MVINFKRWKSSLKEAIFLRWKLQVLGCLVGKHFYITLNNKTYCVNCEHKRRNNE